MFTVEGQGSRLRFSFRHDQVEVTLPTGERRMADRTLCRLREFRANGTEGPRTEVGVIRHTADAPNRKTARKYALAKLLRQDNATKSVRRTVWQAYWDTIANQQWLAQIQQNRKKGTQDDAN